MIVSNHRQGISTLPLQLNCYSFNRLCRSLVFHRLQGLEGSIKIQDPWGEARFGQGSPSAQLEITDLNFYRNALQHGGLGLAHSWVDHGWETPDLTTLLRVFVRNQEIADRFGKGISWLTSRLAFRRHQRRANTLTGSQKNIHDHYDIGNDFFSLILDDTMTYSSGIFERQQTTLKEASIAKLDRICQMLDLQSDDHLVEVGCGWGSFAIHAARHYGCRVTGITISPEQHNLATKRVSDAGLSKQVKIQLSDYRHLEGEYNKLASIEMIESVGHAYLPLFLQKCSSILAPGGRMALQAITLSDKRYAQYLRNSDFIQQYIFPGGCLLSRRTLEQQVADNTDLQITEVKDIGPHYAETLRRWRDNFWQQEEEIRSLGYTESFMRIWHYYFCYCEAGFEEHYLGVLQVLLTKSIQSNPCRGTAPS